MRYRWQGSTRKHSRGMQRGYQGGGFTRPWRRHKLRSKYVIDTYCATSTSMAALPVSKCRVSASKVTAAQQRDRSGLHCSMVSYSTVVAYHRDSEPQLYNERPKLLTLWQQRQ